jgi:hypothetical protein
MFFFTIFSQNTEENSILTLIFILKYFTLLIFEVVVFWTVIFQVLLGGYKFCHVIQGGSHFYVDNHLYLLRCHNLKSTD